MGLYHGVADTQRPELAARVNQTMDQIKADYPGQVHQILDELANRMI